MNLRCRRVGPAVQGKGEEERAGLQLPRAEPPRRLAPACTKARETCRPWQRSGLLLKHVSGTSWRRHRRVPALPSDPAIAVSFLPVNEVFWIHYFEAFPFVSQFQFQSYISDCANFVCSCFFLHFHSAARKPEKEILQLGKQKVALILINNNYDSISNFTI